MTEQKWYHKFGVADNQSGLEPKGRAILVELYAVATETPGGIAMPDQVVAQNQLAEQRAVVIACGPLAWCTEPEVRAHIGDHVYFAKYSGYQARGPKDGKAYRLINDTDVFCTITHHQDGTGQEGFIDQRDL